MELAILSIRISFHMRDLIHVLAYIVNCIHTETLSSVKKFCKREIYSFHYSVSRYLSNELASVNIKKMRSVSFLLQSIVSIL
jgi:hypothetical protein